MSHGPRQQPKVALPATIADVDEDLEEVRKEVNLAVAREDYQQAAALKRTEQILQAHRRTLELLAS